MVARQWSVSIVIQNNIIIIQVQALLDSTIKLLQVIFYCNKASINSRQGRSLAFKIGGPGNDCSKKDFESGDALPIRRICDKLLQLVQLVTHVDVKRGE